MFIAVHPIDMSDAAPYFLGSALPEGLQLPAGRMIWAVTGLPADVVDNPVRIMGFENSRKQIDAQVQLDYLAAYKHQHRIH